MSDSLLETTPPNDEAPAEIGFRSFAIAGYRFMCEPEVKMELINAPTIYPIPNSSKYCTGLINLRGSLVPIFNIHTLLDIDNHNYKWILVIGDLTQAAAIIIDDLPQQHFTEKQLTLVATSNPPEKLIQHILGTYIFNETIHCLFIDHESLFEFLSIHDQI